MLFSSEKILLDDPPEVAPPRRARRKAAHECPKCESRSIARSRIRGVFGHTLKRLFGVRPYRCLDCWHRFVGQSASRQSQA